ncbi:GntR family transcriptional regulator (plasmid) [Burkholderia sp. THE68]|uniref:GntR family transcriptional regulator n=1 Tax=Burkholderiaceae TaxID=119060 RepID=UPI001318000C|nr:MULTISPECIES: GntR family transcriptional regulator [Burkholderiaceae]BBU33415.1 GntR family transcriptional regulator [Burkholderia sp. THE68]BCQ28674.1 GntR family transcriptional regulator [Caballeronia sp. NK8]BCQ30228.1 GntR family transcriptional regulator [Caballeronia sp. NK8]
MKNKNFFNIYQSRVVDNPVKHEYLKEVFIAAIEDGFWKDGDKLPTEQEMSQMVPFSLGTIQKAVGSLVNEGYVERKRALGTFVIPREKRLGEPWIYQVLSSDGTRFIPMTSTVIRRVQIESDDSWARWLCGAGDDRNIIRLDRKIDAEDHSFISHYFADATRFPYFAEIPLDDLESENFVRLTKTVYKVSATKIVHTVKADILPKTVSDALQLPSRTYGAHIEIMGSSSRGEPVFYQRLYLPSGGPRLYL